MTKLTKILLTAQVFISVAMVLVAVVIAIAQATLGSAIGAGGFALIAVVAWQFMFIPSIKEIINSKNFEK